jgi:hypothetical protein
MPILDLIAYGTPGDLVLQWGPKFTREFFVKMHQFAKKSYSRYKKIQNINK